MNKAAGIKLYFDVIFFLFLSLSSIFAFSGMYRPTLEKYWPLLTKLQRLLTSTSHRVQSLQKRKGAWNTGIQNLPLETHQNPRCFKSSLNPHLSSPVYCDCPVTFLHKGQRPHTEQMREQEAELMLRSLCGSTHPQGDTVHWPDRLKLATTLQDGCHNAPSISSAAYTFILNLAELSLSFSGCD